MVALLAGIALCWILITPPGAGPDEPSHLTRSGSLAYGQIDGEYLADLKLTSYDVPDEYLLPDPTCYAIQHPDVPVSCAAPAPRPGGTLPLASRADEYPLWGHLTYGIASRLPGPDPIWWARIGGAAIAVALIAASGAARRFSWGWAGLLVALTPMAWSTMTTVNPSSFGIGGAVALWTALLLPADRRATSQAAWLTAAGWAALALPRRDGLIWACMILVIALAASDRDPVAWWRRLGLGPQLVVAASTAATLFWGATSGQRVTQAVVLSPMIVVAAAVGRRIWLRWGTTVAVRGALAGGAAGVGAITTVVLVWSRPGGWDAQLTRDVVDQTGANLEEAIGVLGWLDTSLPFLAVVLAVAAIGMLASASIIDRNMLVVVAAAILAVAIVSSWVLELYQGGTSARYWQGRYSLPLLVGVPIALTSWPATGLPVRRLGQAAAVSALLTLNIALWAAARRWGVGIDGTLAPWRWGTVHQPIEPAVLLVAHAAFTAGAMMTLFGPSAALRSVEPPTPMSPCRPARTDTRTDTRTDRGQTA